MQNYYSRFKSRSELRLICCKVKRKGIIKNYHNQIPHPTLEIKRERSTHTQIDKCIRKIRRVSKPKGKLFPEKNGYSVTLLKTAVASILTYFLFKLQNKKENITSTCYSVDHVAGDHIHTDITTRNIEEQQKKYALGRSVIDY